MKYSTQEQPLPINDVRLVHTLTDANGNPIRDVIVKLIRGGAPYEQREMRSNVPRHTRYIAGEDIVIPWIEETIEDMATYEGDTTRLQVEHESWTPTIYDSPLMSEASVASGHDIFNELFEEQRYSRARETHDEEYVKMKVLEDARAEWYKARKLQSPTQRLVEENQEKVVKMRMQQREEGMSEETRRIIEAQMHAAAAAVLDPKEESRLKNKTKTEKVRETRKRLADETKTWRKANESAWQVKTEYSHPAYDSDLEVRPQELVQ
jgi:large subunit ribosomal protein L24